MTFKRFVKGNAFESVHKEFPNNFKRVSKEFQKNSKRIPKEFQKNPPKSKIPNILKISNLVRYVLILLSCCLVRICNFKFQPYGSFSKDSTV